MIRGRKYALVAGGAGFIGSHLVESLTRDGWVIDVVDSFATGNIENLRPAMEAAFELDDRSLSLRIASGDTVRLQKDPSRQEEGNSAGSTTFANYYDVVYNLACPASPKAYQADPIGTVMTNVVGTANMLALADVHQAVMVQASTSEVYGDPKEHPQREAYLGNVNPYGPRACYDESKRTAETLCYEFRKRGVDARVARIFNTYGERLAEDDGRVVSTFVRQAIQGEPLTVFGDGSQTRSFCYVSDLVNGLRLLGEAPSWTHGPVNLGNDCEFTINELAEALSEWFPKLLVINELLPKDDPKVRKPCLDLARAKLGYNPKVTLREGLLKVIGWMKNRVPST